MSKATERDIKRHARFFDIRLSDGKSAFTRNCDKIDNAGRHCGFFSILTNTAFSSQEALEACRDRDSIEKGFNDIKNFIVLIYLETAGLDFALPT
jgi:transposase